MAKTDGLVWKSGDDGWKKIPTGIGYVQRDFDVEDDDAVVRVENGVVAGYGGQAVDFRNANDLLQAFPAQDLMQGGVPVVVWAGVHPTNLRAAILVWNTPVTILDINKISPNASVGLNGRIMTVELPDVVDIDGGMSLTVTILPGAVGAYTSINDPNQGKPPQSGIVYPATRNDSAVGADTNSQTQNDYIPAYAPCGKQSIDVRCVLTYTVADAKQPCGKFHKIWGACYCIWGSTAPMDLFPFGQGLDIDPGSLLPVSGRYAGTVPSYTDRGEQINIVVAGVSGPIIRVSSYNDKDLPWQAGQAVTFTNYLCHTVCGHTDQTQVEPVDDTLAYVDEDIIKPKLRTMTVYTFQTTTYYFTTIPSVKTTQISSFTSTFFYSSTYTSIWSGLTDAAKAVKFEADMPVIPKGKNTSIAFVTASAGTFGAISQAIATGVPVDPKQISIVTDYSRQYKAMTGGILDPGVEGKLIKEMTDVVIRALPTDSVALSATQPPAATVTPVTVNTENRRFVPEGASVITATPTGTPITQYSFGTPTTIYGYADNAERLISAGYVSAVTYLSEGSSSVFEVNPDTSFVDSGATTTIPTITEGTEVVFVVYSASEKVITGEPGTASVTPITVSDQEFNLVPAGSKVVSADPTPATLSRTSSTLTDGGAGKFVTSIADTTLGTAVLNVCLGDGSSTTITVLTANTPVTVVTSIGTAAGTPTTLYYLSAAADVSVLTTLSLATGNLVTRGVASTGVAFNVITSISTGTPSTSAIKPLITGAGTISVVTSLNTQMYMPGGYKWFVDSISYGTTDDVMAGPVYAYPQATVVTPLTAGSTIDVITAVPVGPPTTESMQIVTAGPPINVITQLDTVQPHVTTAVTIVTTEFTYYTDPKLVVDEIFTDKFYVGLSTQNAVLPLQTAQVKVIENVHNEDVFVKTAEYTILSTDIQQPEVTDLTITGIAASGDKVSYMQPDDVNKMTLAIVDPDAPVVNIIAPSGPAESQVKVVFLDTNGNMQIIGKTDNLCMNFTTRTPKGTCTPGATTVTSNCIADYEDDGEIILLAPNYVQKSKGDAEDCPCFTTPDPTGAEDVTAPVDNSAISSYNPCTIRVRRLQLRECHL